MKRWKDHVVDLEKDLHDPEVHCASDNSKRAEGAEHKSGRDASTAEIAQEDLGEYLEMCQTEILSSAKTKQEDAHWVGTVLVAL